MLGAGFPQALGLASPLPDMPLVDTLIYDLVVRARLCDPLRVRK